MAQAIPGGVPGRPAGPRPVLNFPSRRPPRWRWLLPAALLLVLAALAALYATGQLTALQRRILGQTATVTYQTATVSRGTVAETVPATGPISAAKTLPLTFKSSGRLADLKVAVGQRVKQGDVLAQLDPIDLQAALDQAKAQLSQQQAAFNKLKAGATPEQLQAAQVALQNAQQAANDAAQSASASQASAAKDVEAAQASIATSQGSLKASQDGLAAAQDAATQKLAADQVAVDNAQKALDSSRAVVATSPAILKQQLEKAKDDLYSGQVSRDLACSHGGGGQCDAAKATVAGLETAVNNFNATAAQTQKQNDQTVQNAQNALETAKAQLAGDQTAQAAAIKTAENSVKAAEAGLNSAQVGVSQAQVKAAASAKSGQQTANSAQGQVKTAEASLATTAAPTTQADLDAQAAQIANALVAVKLAENNLTAATLTAPMDGTVTAISAVAGQQISGGSASTGSSTSSSSTTSSSATGGFITLATLDDLQVTANVNEADVGKIAKGQPVSFTVAAFPGKTFTGQVTELQPTGTTTSNVVNFAVTSSIKSLEGATLYPGMTANVTITTAEQRDALIVPNSALTYARTRFSAANAARQGGAGAATGGATNAGGTTGGATAGGAANGGGAATGRAGANGGAGRAGANGAATNGGGGRAGAAGAANAGGATADGASSAATPAAGEATSGGAGAIGGTDGAAGGVGGATGATGPTDGAGAATGGAGSATGGRGAANGPRGASGQSVVFVLQNGQPVPVRVTTGISDGTSTAVTGDLQEGQAVVTGQSGGEATATGATGQRANAGTSNPLTGGGPRPGIKPGG